MFPPGSGAIDLRAYWEHFEHGADIGVRGIGPDKSAAFAQAALSLTAVMLENTDVAAEQCIEIHCSAPEDDLLLADWLNAIIYEAATRRMVFGRFEVSIEGDRLDALAWGEPLVKSRFRPVVEVKAATYTELKVYQDERGFWIAQCVVDV